MIYRSRPHKRSSLFVDSSVQGALIGRVLLHWCIAGIVAVLYLLVLQVFSTSESLSLSQHVALMWTKYGALVVVWLTLFPLFAYDTVKLSHRFAGPMVSFRAALQKLAAGEKIMHVNFRSRDCWQELATHLNEVAQKLGQVEADPANSSSSLPS